MSRQLPVNRFTTTAQGLVPAPGTAGGLFLRDDGTWASVPGGFVSPLTTKGDVLGFDTVNNRIPVGADGTVLTADSTQALGVKWNTAAGSGTVTSVGLLDGSATPIYTISGSPVVGAGTLTYTFKTQTANTVLAGPVSGAAAQPTFRALVAADGVVGIGGSLTAIAQGGGSPQTYNVPAGATTICVICKGGGGGGGSGARIASGTNVGGGGGGQGGGVSKAIFRASDLGSTVSVTFSNTATGGNGGAVQSGVGSGNPGIDGSSVSFGAFLIALGGTHGNPGASGAGGAGGNSASIGKDQVGTAGGPGSTNGTGANATALSVTPASSTNYGPTGGGGGGGVAAGPVHNPGGIGGVGSSYITLVGGTAGAAGGGTGGNGTNGGMDLPATGGGGGGSGIAAENGGTGGNGGNAGGGGGGGGACNVTGTNSGAGGNGGPAVCYIVAW